MLKMSGVAFSKKSIFFRMFCFTFSGKNVCLGTSILNLEEGQMEKLKISLYFSILFQF